MTIGNYFSIPAEFLPYDPLFPKVAELLRDSIHTVAPALEVEHIGSTSVPGCGGKGVIDLAVLYPNGLLVRAREVLDGLGFQKQGGPEPFPEERPMRVGCVTYKSRQFRIHAHVICVEAAEYPELVWFRDSLRNDETLRKGYEARKQAILESGIKDPIEYCHAKGTFITDALKRYQQRNTLSFHSQSFK